MSKFALIGPIALAGTFAAGLSGIAPAMAFTATQFFNETDTGFVGAIPTSAPAITIASDGEAAFDPFGAGFDTSDGIQLNSNWQWAGTPNAWRQLAGTFTWVLPASTSCGGENEPRCENVGSWLFPRTSWQDITPQAVVLLEPDGRWSDTISMSNTAAGAMITFVSDPGAVPESSTWAMMLIGFGGLGFAGYRASRKSVALAA
jgi:hypothetical protein